MKRIKKASALLICLLILYGATVGALFKMSKNEMIPQGHGVPTDS